MGRPSGKPNRATIQREKVYGQQGVLPLAYLLEVMRDEAQEQAVRIDCAKAAAPYVHPKLASVIVKGDPQQPLAIVDAVDFASLTHDQRDMLRQLADSLIARRQGQIEDQR